jgi:hypothetical protein
MEIETELSDGEAEAASSRTLQITTNLQLAEGEAELYETAAAMEEGSPVAQALAMVEGIATLVIDGRTLTLTRQPDADWHIIVADVTAALKEFFL